MSYKFTKCDHVGHRNWVWFPIFGGLKKVGYLLCDSCNKIVEMVVKIVYLG